MADVSLRELFTLPPDLQPDALRKLQRRSNSGDSIANVKFLLGQALQACQTPWTEDQHDIEAEDYPNMLMNALTLFSTAFDTMRDKDNPVLPEEILEDYIFTRAVYTRLHRAQAALSLTTAQAIERDLRHFASTHQTTLPKEKLSSILQAAYKAAPSASQYAQDEHILSGLQRDDERIERIAQRDAETPKAEADGSVW